MATINLNVPGESPIEIMTVDRGDGSFRLGVDSMSAADAVIHMGAPGDAKVAIGVVDQGDGTYRLGVDVVGGAGGAAWGEITGTLSDQTDLDTALDGKETANANIQAHIASAHAPSDAQKNSNITKAEIEAKLTGQIASHTHAGGSEAFPVGSLFMATVATDPSILLGYGTWAAHGTGRMLIGINLADPDFDTVGETGGAKTVTLDTTMIPAHGHTQDAHTHTQNSHNHTQDAHTHTQNAHNHTQDAHTHTQNSHTHGFTDLRGATTGGATTLRGVTEASDTSSTATGLLTAAATPTNQNATATNQAATATDQNATATNQAATAVNQNATATNQNTGGGLAHNNMPPYIVCYIWNRTA